MPAKPSPDAPWIPPRQRPPPPMDHAPGFKESAYTPQMGELILERIAAGETVKQITADPAMPSYATVYRWNHVIPEFEAAWRALRARLAADAVWLDEQRRVARDWVRAHERRLAGKPPRGWRSGRQSSYTREIAETVCAALREGAALSAVARRPGMPSCKAIYRWLRNEPEFRAAYAEACDWRAGWLDFQATMIAEETSPATFRADRLRVARLDGRIGRMRPRKYQAPPQEPEASGRRADVGLQAPGDAGPGAFVQEVEHRGVDVRDDHESERDPQRPGEQQDGHEVGGHHHHPVGDRLEERPAAGGGRGDGCGGGVGEGHGQA
jgi:terminase small subunit-like protein